MLTKYIPLTPQNRQNCQYIAFTMSIPSLAFFPAELILEIAKHLEPISSVNAFLQTNRYFSILLTDDLHQRGAIELRSDTAYGRYEHIVMHDLGSSLARLLSFGLPLTVAKDYTSKPLVPPFHYRPPQRTPSYWPETAARLGKPAVLRAYLDAGASMESDGGATMESDIEFGHLLRRREGTKYSLLHAACSGAVLEDEKKHCSHEGQLEVVRLLLEMGVDLDYTDQFYSASKPLTRAIKAGNLEMVRLLMANIEWKEQIWHGTLQYATGFRDPEMSKLVLEWGSIDLGRMTSEVDR